MGDEPAHSDLLVRKVVLFGAPISGKTCLLLRLCYDRFDAHQPGTLGVNYGSKCLKLQDLKIKLNFWDTAGCERLDAITHTYYQGAHVGVLAVDLSCRSSFQTAKKRLELSRKLSDMFVTLIGCKSDLRGTGECIPRQEIETFAKSEGMPYVETSAITGENTTAALQMIAQASLGLNTTLKPIASNRCLITMVGSGGAGKSSTLRSLKGERFIPRRISTRGASALILIRRSELQGMQEAQPTSASIQYFCTAHLEQQANGFKSTEDSLAMTSAEEHTQSPRDQSTSQAHVSDVARLETGSTHTHLQEEFVHDATAMSFEGLTMSDMHEDNILLAWHLHSLSLKTVTPTSQRARDLVSHIQAQSTLLHLSVFDMGGQTTFWSITSMFQRDGGLSCVVARADRLLAALDPTCAPRRSMLTRLGASLRGDSEAIDPFGGDSSLSATQELWMWLDSVTSTTRTGNILIIITFGDTVRTDTQRAMLTSFLTTELCKHHGYSRFCVDTETNLPYFLVDNKAGLKDPTVSRLAEVIQARAKASVMATTMCPAWVKVLQDAVLALSSAPTHTAGQPRATNDIQLPPETDAVVNELRLQHAEANGSVVAISVDDLKRLAYSVYHQVTEIEFKSAIDFLHHQNVLSHFRTGILNDFVLLSPEWFVDSVTRIVRDPVLHPLQPEDGRADRTQFDRLYQRGLLHPSLAELYLSHCTPSQQLMLVRLMAMASIIVPIEDDGDTQFIVPSLLRPSDERVPDHIISDQPHTTVYFAITGSGVTLPELFNKGKYTFPQPPAGLFTQLQAAMIRHSQASTASGVGGVSCDPLLSRDYSFMWLGPYPIELAIHRDEGLIAFSLYGRSILPIYNQIEMILSRVLTCQFNGIAWTSYCMSTNRADPCLYSVSLIKRIQQGFDEHPEELCALEHERLSKSRFEALFKPFVPRRNKPPFHVFVSYRHGKFDSLATAQFVNSIDGMVLHNGSALNTFYDALSLSEGERFDTEFMMGMCQSMIFVPFFSADCLRRMTDASNVDTVDHVLLEWSLALHLKEHNTLQRILPIFIGSVSGQDTALPSMSNLFLEFQVDEHVPDVVNEATHARLEEFCSKHLPDLPAPSTKTVRRIVSEISRFNSSSCLCWDVAGDGGHSASQLDVAHMQAECAATAATGTATGAPIKPTQRRQEDNDGASSAGAVQGEPIPSLQQKLVELSTGMKRFLHIFSMCGKHVTKVLHAVMDEQAAHADAAPTAAQEHVERPIQRLGTDGCQQLQGMMGQHKAFAQYVPMVSELQLTIDLIELYTEEQLCELLGFRPAHAAIFQAWLARQCSA
eukprot:m.80349 g.80349  ORF g.80349 m.80349 type:complete len:1311 (-) comp12597_c0_seq6:624-4556(-)